MKLPHKLQTNTGGGMINCFNAVNEITEKLISDAVH